MSAEKTPEIGRKRGRRYSPEEKVRLPDKGCRQARRQIRHLQSTPWRCAKREVWLARPAGDQRHDGGERP